MTFRWVWAFKDLQTCTRPWVIGKQLFFMVITFGRLLCLKLLVELEGERNSMVLSKTLPFFLSYCSMNCCKCLAYFQCLGKICNGGFARARCWGLDPRPWACTKCWITELRPQPFASVLVSFLQNVFGDPYSTIPEVFPKFNHCKMKWRLIVERKFLSVSSCSFSICCICLVLPLHHWNGQQQPHFSFCWIKSSLVRLSDMTSLPGQLWSLTLSSSGQPFPPGLPKLHLLFPYCFIYISFERIHEFFLFRYHFLEFCLWFSSLRIPPPTSQPRNNIYSQIFNEPPHSDL